jgi:LAS superfamily LD-carboxypeptidase LdcB
MQPIQQNFSSKRKFPITATLLVLSIFIFGGLVVFGYKQISFLQTQIQQLTQELDSSNKLHSEKISAVENNITKTYNLTEEIARVLSDSNQTVEGLRFAIGETSNTVSILEKLSKTDPEFLQKYSKVYFLNEHYTPQRVAQIDQKYVYDPETPEQIHTLVAPYLNNLLAAAHGGGIPILIKSAYRSFDEQENLKSAYKVTYGAGTANQFSADQGYSEHQLGTTIDLTTSDHNGKLDGFESTEAYRWMQNNAHMYGFTLSYPEDNTFYVFEPWHWRYVGVKLATYLRDQGKHFYDLDQREIDEYLINLFE